MFGLLSKEVYAFQGFQMYISKCNFVRDTS